MKNVRYEYVIEDGDYITDRSVLTTREEARHELREVKSAGFTKAKIIQRKYELKQERTVR